MVLEDVGETLNTRFGSLQSSQQWAYERGTGQPLVRGVVAHSLAVWRGHTGSGKWVRKRVKWVRGHCRTAHSRFWLAIPPSQAPQLKHPPT